MGFDFNFSFMSGEDLSGNPVEKSKYDYPYSYSSYVEWRNGENSEITDSVYSDRLFQWNPEKYNRLCQKHFGNQAQTFSGRKPEDIERFLSEYLGINLKLIVILQGCNQSSGYPFWSFHFKGE
jgi:hypothetical protein